MQPVAAFARWHEHLRCGIPFDGSGVFLDQGINY